MPPSFNYYGLLGPWGKDYGQTIIFCQECTLEGIQEHSYFFMIDEERSLNAYFDAVIQGYDHTVGMTLN